MLAKIYAIAWKDIYTAFKDRNAILLMLAMPLILSVIIGLVFGSGGDVSINPIRVGVENEGGPLGAMMQSAFVPGDGAANADFQTVHDLTDGEIVTDPGAARQQVEDGDLTALITVPNLDAYLSATPPDAAPPPVTVYYDSGSSIGSSVVRSIVQSIADGWNTVFLAQQVGTDALASLGEQSGIDMQDAQQALADTLQNNPMAVAQSTAITLNETDLQGETRDYDALQYFAPSMAILFMTFTMAAGGRSILNEQKDWTLQRIMTTATPRGTFMIGKLAGTYLTGVIQMVILIVATTLVAKMMGREASVWGTHYVGIALLVLAVSFAATSLGLLIAAAAKTAEQADAYSTAALFVLGMLGGSFVPIEGLPDALSWLPKITLNYWGIRGFFALAYDKAQLSDISTHLLALAGMGIVLFAISLWRFNKRLDI
jgi:ABC-2 type transport system permease protein